ncbi:MAG: protein kinase [Myxococcales bacterium]|nr:protein kinase [Myxococcales bacterium]
MLAALALTWLCAASPASALDPDRAITQYRHQVWSAGSGLGDDTITALTQTRDGFLWIGTAGGLVRYDGVRFTRPAVDDSPTFRGRRVLSMTEDARGDLWVATDADALARLRGGVLVETLDSESGLPAGELTSLAADARALWIATSAGLVRRDLESGALRRFTAADGLPSDEITALHLDADGSIWIGTASAGLARVEITDELEVRSTQTRYTTQRGLPSDAVGAITRDLAGDLWVGTDGGLGRLREGDWKTYKTDSGLSGDDVTTLQVDRNGNLWIGTAEGGLSRIANGRVNRFTPADGLASASVQALAEDHYGNIWIGTLGGGLEQLADAPYILFSAREGLPVDSVSAVLGDDEGVIWLGTLGGGLVRYAGGSLTTFNAAGSKLPSDTVQALHLQPSRGLWVGTERGLARVVQDKVEPALAELGEALPRSITAITSDLRGNLWLGTAEDGLVRYNDSYDVEPLRRYAIEDGLTSETITTLHVDADDQLWIGTRGGGLLRMDGDEITRQDDPDDLIADVIRVIHEDPGGALWVGTEHTGLLRVQDGVIDALTAAEGLPDDSVLQILEDGAGNFWLTGSGGLYRVVQEELAEVADGLRERVDPVAIEGNAIEGSANIGVRPPGAIGSPNAWRASDGDLWFATDAGVMKIDPEPTPRVPAPPVVLESVRVDGHTLDPSTPLTLAPGARTLTIDYTVPAFVAPDQLRFRYILEGFDAAWTEAGARRTAIYTSLPPGAYRFRVAASTGLEEWSSTETVLALTQEDSGAWGRGVVLVVALVLLLALLGALAHVLRMRATRARLEVHRRESSARARELREATREMVKLRRALAKARERPELEMWVRALALDLARPLEASAIDVWLLEDAVPSDELEDDSGARELTQELTALTETIADPPPLHAVREAAQSQRVLVHDDTSLAAIHGAGWAVGFKGGESLTPQALLGVVVIRGRATTWDESEQRLVLCFAQQIGAAVELARLREAITAEHSRVVVTRERLIARGDELLTVCAVCRRCYAHTVERCPEDQGRLEVQGVLPYKIMGRYRMIRFLGQGGMGTVYEAIDQRLDRQVAIKIIRPEYFRDVNVRMRFRQEARSIAKISHPGVIALYDTGELGDGSAFLVMEKLEGLDLADLLHDYGPATPQQVALLLRQGGAALTAAHAVALVHRDIKPENIFLVEGPGGHQVKILDFGLAKSMGLESTSLTQTGVVMGTPVYMSPEQIQGKDLDARSDLYSFACVCYEALTGRRVVESEEFARICAEVMHTTPPPLRQYVPEIPSAVDRAFHRALKKRRDERHDSIHDWVESFVTALERVEVRHRGWPDRLRAAPTIDLEKTAPQQDNLDDILSASDTALAGVRERGGSGARESGEPADPAASQRASEDGTVTTQFRKLAVRGHDDWQPPRA